jgi:uncharacterized protein YbjT (DUF2867 family)
MYAIAGVSGNTGKVVADVLIKQRQPVRVIVRDAAKGAPWAARGAEVAVADLEDPGALTRALKGVDGAYLLMPPAAPQATGMVERARRLTAVAKRAIETSGVKHVVFLSSVGADRPDSGMITTLHSAEQELRTLRTPVTFVRAGYFLENWAGVLPPAVQQGVLPTFLAPERPIGMVATKDIGFAAAQALREAPEHPQILDVAGPRDYSPADIAATLSRLLGRTITARRSPLDELVPTMTGLGFSTEQAELFREMTAGVNDGRIRPGEGLPVRGSTPPEEVLGALVRGPGARG